MHNYSLVYNITENVLATKPMLLQNGFKKTVVFPSDPSAPNMTPTKPSQIYTEDKSSVIEKVSTLSKKPSSLDPELSPSTNTQYLSTGPWTCDVRRPII